MSGWSRSAAAYFPRFCDTITKPRSSWLRLLRHIYPFWVWPRPSQDDHSLFDLEIFPIDRRQTPGHWSEAGARMATIGYWHFWIKMTFIIEAGKGDQHTAQIRSSAMGAVILARKLAADGFAVSITDPSGHRYVADQFISLLTSKNVNEAN